MMVGAPEGSFETFVLKVFVSVQRDRARDESSAEGATYRVFLTPKVNFGAEIGN
jgi:hypothetical protein